MIIRNRYFILLDVLTFPLLAAFSFLFRLESLTRPTELTGMLAFAALAAVVKLSVFFVSGIYQRYWRNAGSNELLLLWRTTGCAGLIVFGLALAIDVIAANDVLSIPRSIGLIDLSLTLIYVTVIRFAQRAFGVWQVSRSARFRVTVKRAIVIGAGNAGVRFVESLDVARNGVRVVAFLDDDRSKQNAFVRGIQVYGRIQDLKMVSRRLSIDLVIVAIPSAPGRLVRQILQDCRELNIESRTVPGVNELATGQVTINSLRPIRIEDLLRRKPVALENDRIRSYLSGKRVLVTGAGGSIGSELVRQIASMNPAVLILVGRGENSLFLIESELRAKHPIIPFETYLVDVQDRNSLERVFADRLPQVVFHAAAHKHVPMLESNVRAGVTNNVIGTKNVIDLSNHFNIERMVLLSTDKAVEPNSVMGMSKRCGELLLLHASFKTPGRFAAVRFGNVLGSRGSVVPTFQRQIEAGGPVTVTSEEMTRFFMSIPEAASLVLNATILVDQGPLFVLNMGEPVRIIDLARDLIRLSGGDKGDIEVRVTGVRPGEKMHEALLWDFENQDLVEQGSIFSIRLSEENLNRVNTLVEGWYETLERMTTFDNLQSNDMRAVLYGFAYLIPGRAVEGLPQPKRPAQPKFSSRAEHKRAPQSQPDTTVSPA